MKKVFLLNCSFLLVFITSMTFGEIIGGRLDVTIVTVQQSYVSPRKIEMTIINEHTKKWVIIWVEHVIENIYDIKRRPDGLQFGQAVLIGTADVYSRDFQSLIIKQCKRLGMEDDRVWQEQADIIARMYSDYIIRDINKKENK